MTSIRGQNYRWADQENAIDFTVGVNRALFSTGRLYRFLKNL